MTTEAAAPKPGNALGAAFWMLGSIASFTLMAVAGREMAGTLNTFEIMTYRSIIGLALVAGYGVYAGHLPGLKPRRLKMHLTRNLFHFAGQNLWFYSLALIPLAHVFAFEFTVPIWVALLAPLFLGEAMTRRRVFATLLGFLGILLVARPGLAPLGSGHFAVMMAAVCFAATYLTTKSLSASETVWSILFWLTLTQLGFGVLCALAAGGLSAPPMSHVHWVILIGLCGLTAHLSITAALSLAPATIVAPMDFLRLPLIATVGMMLYDEPLEVAVFAGAALIFLANLMNLRAEKPR